MNKAAGLAFALCSPGINAPIVAEEDSSPPAKQETSALTEQPHSEYSGQPAVQSCLLFHWPTYCMLPMPVQECMQYVTNSCLDIPPNLLTVVTWVLRVQSCQQSH